MLMHEKDEVLTSSKQLEQTSKQLHSSLRREMERAKQVSGQGRVTHLPVTNACIGFLRLNVRSFPVNGMIIHKKWSHFITREYLQ